MTENQGTTASLMPPGSPERVNCALPIRQDADISILLAGFFRARKTETLYVAGSKPNT